MPYKIKKVKGGKFGVYNTEKKIWKSKSTTKDKATKQMRLLNYLEYK